MRPTSLIASVLLLSILPGCQFFSKSGGGKLSGAGMDMFTPVKMRLHPLSRVTPSPSVVEARLEFTDQFGDVGKGVGDAQFELFAYDAIGLGHKGRRLGQWPMPLATPAENRDHWDAITRTYLFKFTPDLGSAQYSRFVLTATFTLPNGQELSDDITLPAK